MNESTLTGLEIAIVGMAGRFPGARTTDELWRNLAEGREGIARFGDDELAAAGVPAALRADPDYVPARGALAGTELFDAAFFGFNAREAAVMDPQHRLFLECAWEALENAGYDPGSYPGAIGIYAGSSLRSHAIRVLSDPSVRESVGAFQAVLSNDKDFLATRTAYKLGLRGPALTVQTACSTSLVAVHLACRSLLGGECSMAMAGGVSASAEERGGHRFDVGGILSPDGHCRAFDAKSGGTVNGSGLAIVVLKRLDDALADGDTIHAVIKGTAINNDGDAKVGFTAPSVEGQARAIADALAFAEVDASTVGYVEAHGTGTALGDPIEVAALTQAFRAHTDAERFCAIGAVKTNVGHLDAASGVTGFVKAALSVRNALVPPTLHFTEPNPSIAFEGSPFFVADRLQPWPLRGVRRAGVSSFGVGGTNAHAVLEQAPETEPGGPSRPLQLLALSARTPAALERARAALAAHLRERPEQPLADVAHTLRVGRAAFRHRCTLVARTAAEAAQALDAAAVRAGEAPAGHATVAFAFPAAHAGGIAGIYASEAVFRAEMDRCAGLLRPRIGVDLREVLGAADGAADGDALARPAVARAAAFAVGYALAKQWTSWGIVPDAVVGQGGGELAAACVAGVFALEDAAALAAMDAMDAQAVRRANPAAPAVRMLNGATGAPVTADEAADAAFWARPRPAGRMADAAAALLAEPGRVVLELGAAAIDRSAVPAGRVVASLSADADPAPDAVAGDSLFPVPYSLQFMLDAAGALWLAGARPDWHAFVEGERRRRVPLPTYPFERRAFRLPAPRIVALPAAAPQPEPAPAARVRARTHTAADLLHRPVWSPAEAPQSGAMEPASWLLLEDEGGIGAIVAEQLAAAGHRVARVRAGDAFARTGDAGWTVRPAVAADWDSLLWAMGDANRPAHVVHLWSAGPAAGDFMREQERGALSVLHLAAALARRAVTRVRIVSATAGVFDVSGEESLCAERMTVAGVLRAVERQQPFLCRHVDFGTDAGPRAAARKAAQLLAELLSGEGEAAAAYRGRQRFALEWDAPSVELSAGASVLRQDVVYLISGGLTVAGLDLAEQLAAPGVRLALIGGMPVPPREMWERVIAACSHASGPIDQLRRIEGKGAEIAFSSADVADAEALGAFVSQARERWGAVHRVIHAPAAESLDDPARAMAGIAALRGAVAASAPDACVLLGDLAWQTGTEPAARAVSHALLAGVAQAESRESAAPWICLDVDGVDAMHVALALNAALEAPSAHLAVGMMDPAARIAGLNAPAAEPARCPVLHTLLADKESPAAAESATDAQVCPVTGARAPAETAEAAESVAEPVAAPMVQAQGAVCPFTGAKASAEAAEAAEAAVEETAAALVAVAAEVGAPVAEPAAAGPARFEGADGRGLGTAYVAPTTDLEIRIAELWQELLGAERVGVHDDFFELGGHSLLGIRVLARLRADLQVQLAPETLFVAPTVAALAQVVEDAFLAELDGMSDEELLAMADA